ncbi:MAG: acetate--CoA ligase family protein [Thiotrichales bacterium]|nr:acetate--CoA ligase family protein [Thiotrichales bacterium]
MSGTDSPSATRIARLLRPRRITVIGGLAAARVAEQCDRMGFDGALWPVHPKRDRIAGRAVFRSIAELPGAPDAAFVGVNRHATVEAVSALARAGAGGAICYASGFRESDDGEALQQALVEAVGEMPILGPNCYGLLNLLDGVALWPDQHGGRRLEPDERGVAIVSQSSNLAISMTMQRRGLPVAYVATAGNQAQLGLSRIARALLDDDRVSALGLHVEGFDSVRGFETLAREARARKVPVVVMKTGRSERGRAANLSHTASIAGSDAGADAFLRRLGFARAPGIPEFLETLKLFHVHGALGGSRLGVMCCSGGEASVLSDAVADTGLTLPEPTPDHAAAVKETLHPLVPVANPLDYHTFSWGDGPALARIFTAFAREAFDAVMLVLDFPRPDRCDDAEWEITAGAFDRAMRASGAKGVIAVTLGENLPEARAAQLTKLGIAPLAGVREALAAIECAARVGTAWRAPPRAPIIVHPAPGDPGSAPEDGPRNDSKGALENEPGSKPEGARESEPRSAPGGAPILLDEPAAKRWLAAFGVPVPPGSVAHDVERAVEIAASLGGPVAMKALGIAHKTERQAVRLGLHRPAEIRDAARALLALGPGVLVERFETEVVAELIVGLHRDPQLGLLLAVGSGGTLVELVADSVTLLLPVTESEVRDALSGLRSAPMLRGWRGRASADVDAAVASILAIADFAIAKGARIEELDVNPLGVCRRGKGAVALDALIRTRESSE